MGLLELCLLPLLLPQQPASQAPTASPAPVAAATAPQGDGRPAAAPAATADPVEVTELKAAERGLATIEIEQLVALTASANPAVATRATWLLGQRKEPKAFENLHELARSAPHADMRLQAMSALLRHGNPTSVATAIAGLDDEDARVRSVAAQLLGRLRNPAGAAPLLALLDRSKKAKSQGPNQTTIDLQAAILALNDMEATEHLLTAATAIDASKAPGTGQALTFYFQNLSPKLTPRDESLLLVGVLGHREPMLRRYAIERLADLADPTASAALEGRLAQEGPELRPLLEVALARVRKQEHGQAQDASTAPKGDVVQQLRERWSAMSQQQQYVTAGFAGLFVISSIFVFSMWRRRSRELLADDVPAVADLVAPSEEYLEELENEATMAAEEAEAMVQTELTGDEEEQTAEDADDDSFVRAMTSGAEDEPDANDAWAPVLGEDSDTDPQRD